LEIPFGTPNLEIRKYKEV